VSDQPVRTVVNTHHHGDHTFGNGLFPTATIVAHEGTREAVLASGPARQLPFWADVEWGSVDLDPPFLTYADAVTLWSGDLRVEVRHVGAAAHTTNDSVATVLADMVAFNGGQPLRSLA
jgi:cyclase